MFLVLHPLNVVIDIVYMYVLSESVSLLRKGTLSTAENLNGF